MRLAKKTRKAVLNRGDAIVDDLEGCDDLEELDEHLEEALEAKEEDMGEEAEDDQYDGEVDQLRASHAHK